MTGASNALDGRDANRLIQSIAERGDREAFARLFETFAPQIKAYLKRAGCAHGEAEELAQETMLTVWRKARLFDVERASAATWIFAIARNRRIDGLRRRPRESLPPEQDVDDAPSPLDALAGADAVSHLRIALAKLPPEQSEVIRAAYLEHNAHAAIAEKLGLPLGTVKSRLRLALRRLRADMEAYS